MFVFGKCPPFVRTTLLASDPIFACPGLDERDGLLGRVGNKYDWILTSIAQPLAAMSFFDQEMR